MNIANLRVALFPDTYHETDGVANTVRQYEAFAARNHLPLLIVYGGGCNSIEIDGSITRMEFRRGRIGFGLDTNHNFDLAFWRHYRKVAAAVLDFKPHVLHITGPSDVGQLGVLIAHRLRVPLAASWHTNVHQYAEERAARLLVPCLKSWHGHLGPLIRRGSLLATLRFYRIARILFAPNPELMEMVERGAGKPCYPMQRGVDTVLFDPAKRDRTEKRAVLGYVGRLTTEKNVRALVEIERSLVRAGFSGFRFMVVGQGTEESWLKANLQSADFTGVLRGEALAKAYANMDVFVFPSLTDTYGNVVLEALASGVPAVVSACGGPQFIVRPGETGYVAESTAGFVARIKTLMDHPELLAKLRILGRRQAMDASWDRVFGAVYAAYERELVNQAVDTGRRPLPSPRSRQPNSVEWSRLAELEKSATCKF